ncbi:DNA polymerase beta superfamily protein [Edaphovirga cremea]|uniref:DNA polymerase beta superfamily protein n=1 Tax=Edaphovirga cremea TaxID=2267246 RepID=UPI001B87B371|nr:nucleotidyltransferase domain-containing protein [Edaphovirga cremea]
MINSLGTNQTIASDIMECIQTRLVNIEQMYQVKILYVCKSGSRTRGFESAQPPLCWSDLVTHRFIEARIILLPHYLPRFLDTFPTSAAITQSISLSAKSNSLYAKMEIGVMTFYLI